MSNTPTTGRRGYNFNVTVNDVSESTNSNGTAIIRAKVGVTLRGKAVVRTLVAQGKAANDVREALVKGASAKIRCLVDHVPTEDGKRGGQFLTAIGMPIAKAA